MEWRRRGKWSGGGGGGVSGVEEEGEGQGVHGVKGYR